MLATNRQLTFKDTIYKRIKKYRKYLGVSMMKDYALKTIIHAERK